MSKSSRLTIFIASAIMQGALKCYGVLMVVDASKVARVVCGINGLNIGTDN
jgi:hypothetical protein